MTDFFLKFATEQESFDVLCPEVTTITTSYDDEGNPVETITTERKWIDGYSIDILGVIYREIGVDNEGNPIIEARDGWHVNLRGADTEEFDQYKVEPTVPARVFA